MAGAKIGLQAVLEDADFQAGMKRYSAGVGNMEAETQKASGGLSKGLVAAAGLAVVGVGLLAKGLWDCTQAAMEEEAGIARLSAAVTASGVPYGEVSAEIETYIAAAQRKTAFDDGVQRESLTALTTTTGSYKTALSLLPLAMDLARAKGMDLSSAAEIVGKVHEGNTGILSRYGIVLAEGATAQEALAAMQQKFAGQAEAYGSTTKAQMELVGQQFDNLKETIGAVVMPVLLAFMSALATFVGDLIPAVEQALAELRPIFEAVWTAIQSAIDLAWGIIKPIFDALVSWFSGPGTAQPTAWGEKLSAIWNGIQALIAVVMPIIQGIIETVWGTISAFLDANGDTIMSIIATAWAIIQNTIDTILGVIQGIIKVFTGLITGDWQMAWDGIKGILTTVWNGIKAQVELVLGLIKDIIKVGWEWVKTATALVWEGIKGAIAAAWEAIKGIARLALDDVRNIISSFSLADAGRNLIQGLANGVTAAAGAIADAVRRAVQGAIAAALAALGIGSPSKVFAAIGVNVSLGLAKGILAAADTVAGATSALSGMAIAGGMGGGRVSSSASYSTITNNTYNLSASYSQYQNETSLRDTVRLLQAGI